MIDRPNRENRTHPCCLRRGSGRSEIREGAIEKSNFISVTRQNQTFHWYPCLKWIKGARLGTIRRAWTELGAISFSLGETETWFVGKIAKLNDECDGGDSIIARKGERVTNLHPEKVGSRIWFSHGALRDSLTGHFFFFGYPGKGVIKYIVQYNRFFFFCTSKWESIKRIGSRLIWKWEKTNYHSSFPWINMRLFHFQCFGSRFFWYASCVDKNGPKIIIALAVM